MAENKTIAVIGAGAWGTSLAMILVQRGWAVRLWEYFPDYAEQLRTTRENVKFLPGVVIPPAVSITSDLAAAVAKSEAAVLAVPAQKMRAVLRQLATCASKPTLWISVAKGIEKSSLCRMSEVIQQELGADAVVCALSGPSHAEEVSRGIPTSVVAACTSLGVAERVQEMFMTDAFRVYTSTDVVGVELGGSLKNVIALAAGVVDGLGYGDNTKAALITRGLAEMGRLGRALNGEAETFSGLSGLGDLVVTCTSRHSRNRRVGQELGQGRKLAEILAGMEMVAEGVETTQSARQLAEKLGVEMPITSIISRVLFEDFSPREAVKLLMQRPPKAEMA